jgi:PAT family beta-lactamase induction signal transducer AmpG
MAVSEQRRSPAAGTVALLTSLYFVQGLPYGFQSNALPLFMAKAGVSLANIGLAGALSIPWLLKPLWAPMVDRFGNARFGRRKSWIVPMQFLLALACIAAAFSEPGDALPRLIVIVLIMNVLTATQDIAVDAFAVDRLGPEDLGLGNSAQVVGYKIGMLAGGGLLVALSAQIQWQGMFFAMAALCLVVMVVLIFQREGAVPGASVTDAEAAPSVGWRELAGRLWAARKGSGWLLVFVATYKVGEELATRMFGPFLVTQHHLEPETVATWLGTWVMIASLLGSLFGGLLATRMPLLASVAWTAALRVVPLVGQWAIVAGFLPVDAGTVIGVASVEHFFAGALTTCMFALMMSRVDKRIGGTHYTLLAAIEVAGKSPSALASGKIVELVGFPSTFGLAVLASVLFMLLVFPMKTRSP